MFDKRTQLTICVLSFEGREVLKECLRSIYSQKGKEQIEVIVTDNGSTDGTAEMIKKYFPDAQLLINSHNKSFTSCYNKMVKASTGMYVAIVSNDIVFTDEHCFNKILDIFSKNEKIGMIAPKSVRLDGTVDMIRKPEQTFYDLFRSYTLLGSILNRINVDTIKEMPDQNMSDYAQVLQDSSVFINKKAIFDDTIYDERMKFYYTEDQLSLDIRRRGFDLYYTAETEVSHHHQYTMKKMDKTKHRLIYFKDALRYSSIYNNRVLTACILYPLGYLSYLMRTLFWYMSKTRI